MRIVLISVLMAFFTYPAFAHGDAEWIMRGTNAYCCGPRDCDWLHKSDIEIRPEGYWIKSRKELILFKDVKATDSDQAHHFWLCVRLYENGAEWPNGPTRCFFAPGAGG